jgi:hypothetical protein
VIPFEPPFDLFVSYSHKDEAWVKTELLPRLESWQIRFCIDFKDFSSDRPVADELRRLVTISRQTLFVLSTNWLSSSFTDFELQLSQEIGDAGDLQRFLPIRIDDCAIPLALQSFQILDAVRFGWPVAWRTLRRSLAGRPTQAKAGILAAEMDLVRRIADCEAGYEYVMDLLVANISRIPRPFDAIDVELLARGESRQGQVAALKIICRPGGARAFFSYHGPGYFRTLRAIRDLSHEEAPQPDVLQPLTAKSLRRIGLGRSAASFTAREVVGLSVQLSLADTPVTNKCYAALPPLLRLPEWRSDHKYHLVLSQENHLPSPSGVLDAEVVNRAQKTAAQLDPGSLLVSVTPSVIETISLSGGDEAHRCNDWRFIFYSDRRSGTFQVPALDPSYVEVDTPARGSTRPRQWLSGMLLDQCRVDCWTAYLMARTAHAQPAGTSLDLVVFVLDGKWRPVWLLPFQLEGQQVGVLADSCEIVRINGEECQRSTRLIWNAC